MSKTFWKVVENNSKIKISSYESNNGIIATDIKTSDYSEKSFASLDAAIEYENKEIRKIIGFI
jgi:hypothetical protein